MFIGRENELNKIRRRLKLDSFQAVLVYGRRRIGKTELINKAIELENVRVLPLLAREVNESINLEEFSFEAGRFMNNVSFHPRDFYEFYASLFEYSKTNPFVLFVDEYSFLKKSNDSIDSYLQKAIELHKNNAKITIILCGSYIETMKRIIDKKSPLYGRFNEEIMLRTFNYYEASKFMGNISEDEKFKYYAVFGGTAFNLKHIDYSIPFEENLLNEFIKADSFFEKEAVATIVGELEKEANINSIFELIARGIRKYTDLNERMGDPSKDNITRYLRKLEEMDLIDKSYQVNAKSERKALYQIKDNLMSFYYSFIFKYQRARSSMPTEVFFQNYVKKELYESYLPTKFEEVVKEYAIRVNSIKLPLFDSIGRLYYNSGNINREFDVVLSTKEGLIPIECKYSDSKVGISDYNEEKTQWKDLPFTVAKYAFASKSGFKDDLKSNADSILITLTDLYN